MNNTDLSKMTRLELRAYGEELGLKSLSALRKNELIDKITQYFEQNPQPDDNEAKNEDANSAAKNDIEAVEHDEEKSTNGEASYTHDNSGRTPRTYENSYKRKSASSYQNGDSARKQTPIPRRVSGAEAKAAYMARDEYARQTNTGRRYDVRSDNYQDSRQSNSDRRYDNYPDSRHSNTGRRYDSRSDSYPDSRQSNSDRRYDPRSDNYQDPRQSNTGRRYDSRSGSYQDSRQPNGGRRYESYSDNYQDSRQSNTGRRYDSQTDSYQDSRQSSMGRRYENHSDNYQDLRQSSSDRHFDSNENYQDSRAANAAHRPDDVKEVCGILDVMADGYGFLRFENYRPGKNDVYVAPSQIRRFRLKTGDEILGDMRPSVEEDKYSPLLYIKTINGDSIDIALHRKPFERLTPIYPTEKLSLDIGGKDNVTSRLIDIIAPIGKGQRGMIVAPPKAGKTTIIKQLAQAITTNNPEVKLIVLLIDERPEEVTDMQRSVNGEIVYSTFDQPAESHCKSAEMVLERAMRLVEHKKDVVILIDSITRLARAYNQTIIPTGRTLSGGIDSEALYKPKKFFGAARNIEEGGSLTVIATALVETGSRMDDVVFEEFKGTGNMEIKLDRNLQERRIFPAVDVLKSSTRREEDLLTPLELETSRLLRRELSHSSFAESVAGIIKTLSNTKNNTEFCNFMISTYKVKK